MSTAFNPTNEEQQPPQPSQPEPGRQKKEYTTKQWLGIGCGIPLAVIVLLVIITAIFGGESDTADDATTEESTITSETQPDEQSSSEEKPAPAPDEGKQDAMPWLESQFGMTPAEVLTSDPTIWYGYVSDAYIDKGNLHVLMQVDRTSDKELGKQAAMAVANFVSFSDDPVVSDVDWAIAENGVGEFIAQESVK